MFIKWLLKREKRAAEKKKDKEQAKERHSNKKGKHVVSPVIR